MKRKRRSLLRMSARNTIMTGHARNSLLYRASLLLCALPGYGQSPRPRRRRAE